MTWRSLFFLFTCLLMQKLVSSQETDGPFTVKINSGFLDFACTGHSLRLSNGSKQTVLSLEYRDENSGEYECVDKDDNTMGTITVRFRTCDNCIELNTPALTAIIVGNILATFLIAFAVYNITGQPKGKNFPGNKASDKVNLLSNGEGDTYQQLTPGQNSEYSRLERKK